MANLLQIHEPGATPTPHEGDSGLSIGIDLGTTNSVVAISTDGKPEVLRDENLGEGDADVAVQIAAAFERAFQALPSGPPRNRLLVEMTADIEMDLTLALIATGEMDRATELIVQTVDTSAADALCGER